MGQVAQFWWRGHDCRVIEVNSQADNVPSVWPPLVRFVECDGEFPINGPFKREQ